MIIGGEQFTLVKEVVDDMNATATECFSASIDSRGPMDLSMVFAEMMLNSKIGCDPENHADLFVLIKKEKYSGTKDIENRKFLVGEIYVVGINAKEYMRFFEKCQGEVTLGDMSAIRFCSAEKIRKKVSLADIVRIDFYNKETRRWIFSFRKSYGDYSIRMSVRTNEIIPLRNLSRELGILPR